MIDSTGGIPSLTGMAIIWPDRFHQPNDIRDILTEWAVADLNHSATCVFHSYKLPDPPAHEAPLPAFTVEPLETDDTLLAAAFDAYILSQFFLCLHVGFGDWGSAFSAKCHAFSDAVQALTCSAGFALVRTIPAAALAGIGSVFTEWIHGELVSAGLCDCKNCPGISPSVRQLTENAYQVSAGAVWPPDG